MREFLFTVGIDDCDIQTFCTGGPGGQHQDRSETGIRIVHRASKGEGECRQFRSQRQNKIEAFKRMANSEKFQRWIRLESARMAGQPSVEEQVEAALAPENLKVEIRQDGRWAITE